MHCQSTDTQTAEWVASENLQEVSPFLLFRVQASKATLADESEG